MSEKEILKVLDSRCYENGGGCNNCTLRPHKDTGVKKCLLFLLQNLLKEREAGISRTCKTCKHKGFIFKNACGECSRFYDDLWEEKEEGE